MVISARTRPPRPWLPWARAGIALALLGLAGWGVLEIGHRYLGLQRFTIEQVSVTGCQGERLVEVQKIADQTVLGKPLFWFDAEGLRGRIEGLRWVKGLLIRKDPPDRLSLVVEERKPILWVVRPNGVFLLSDDGILVGRVTPSNLSPIPVVADPESESDQGLVQLLRVARELRDKQEGFFERTAELRWGIHGPVEYQGPVAFMDGLPAPILLSKSDPARNIPNLQSLYTSKLRERADLTQLRYLDLRWGDDVVVGEPEPSKAPLQKQP